MNGRVFVLWVSCERWCICSKGSVVNGRVFVLGVSI